MCFFLVFVLLSYISSHNCFQFSIVNPLYNKRYFHPIIIYIPLSAHILKRQKARLPTTATVVVLIDCWFLKLGKVFKVFSLFNLFEQRDKGHFKLIEILVVGNPERNFWFKISRSILQSSYPFLMWDTSQNKIEEFCYILGFDSCFSIDRVGRGGGLSLYWRSSISRQIVDYSNNHITVEILDDEKGIWRLTGYYGYPNVGRRQAARDFLRQLSQQSTRPLCIFGDFNDIMDASEKRGRTNRSN